MYDILTRLGKPNRLRRKLLLIMRLTTVLLIASLMQVSAAGFAQKISLSRSNTPLKAIIKSLRQQTGYDFVYNDKVLSTAKPVTVSVKDGNIETVLDLIFSEQPLTYTIDSKTVIIKQKAPSFMDKVMQILSNISVSGKVVNEGGMPLPGATVKIKGTKLEGMTNSDGEFVLQGVPEDGILVITFIGYQSYETKVSQIPNPAVFALRPAINSLDEIIVQGYGTTSKRLNTGNIVKVSATEIERQPVSNPLAALQGRVSGMLVTQTNGLPGGAINIQIRGRTAIDKSITSDEPLFVIDGVPYGAGNSSLYNNIAYAGSTQLLSAVQAGISPFNGINPQDIASIEVLKDADATAIYGSRGANGVILITTKKGTEGKLSVTLNTNYGVSSVANPVQMMNTEQYIAARTKAFENDKITMTDANAFDLRKWDPSRYYNYAKELTGGVAESYNTQLSLNGGSKLTKFALSAGNNWSNTVLSNDTRDKRFNVGFNVSQSSLNEKFLVNFSANYAQTSSNLTSVDLSELINLPPNLKLYNDDGTLSWAEGGYSFNNPLGAYNNRTTSNGQVMYANVQPIYKINDNFKISANAGYNINTNNQRQVAYSTAFKPGGLNNRAINIGTTANKSWTVEPQLEYTKEIFGGRFNGLIGGTLQNTESKYNRMNGNGFTSDAYMSSINNAPFFGKPSEGNSEYRYSALFGRLNYNYNDTYLVNLTGRRDGSSRFGPGKQFANFGAIGAGWIFTNEKFMEDTKSWLSFGKLRTSFGSTGNDKISDYNYLDTWGIQSFTNINWGSSFLYPSKLFNPDYHWESTFKSEYGLDLSFLKDRIMFSSVYYRNSSSDQLVSYQLPQTTGFTYVLANLPAKVINSGFEFTLNTRNIEKGDFSWSTDINITIPKNKLASFPGLASSSYFSKYVVGQPLNVIYAVKSLGVSPETGSYIFEDKNNDGSYNESDYQVFGSTDPKYYGGMQNSFRYKGFNLDFFILFRKTTGQNYKRYYWYNSSSNPTNRPVVSEKIWEQPGDIADLAKLSTGLTADMVTYNKSNGIYSDASYLSLNNVSLSYSLPKSLINKLKISNCRVYVSGQNLLTISPYEIGDPQTQNYLSTPPLRTVSTGLQLTF
ncbi:SusC/RagA family TonB-linked outer membrane protein [Solitalea longa]|uniref:SusC/RagA family TonB-linked outer membrane protein n=1 Tax=Solitalea longa TaxID=2079460 RepID=A0A2S5A748_9SPHI|nr:SusC/RagA family TonB-linked outer membrane protein [Solitalea longa]POY37933.1 SusC/RagA family TonB-linked outer membrane protein [Solitalea longa]